jgi:hypothetical protein
LRKEYQATQSIIDEMLLIISTERLALQADYLEAQLKIATNDTDNAKRIIEKGLDRARILGAVEDENRLNLLLNQLKTSS